MGGSTESVFFDLDDGDGDVGVLGLVGSGNLINVTGYIYTGRLLCPSVCHYVCARLTPQKISRTHTRVRHDKQMKLEKLTVRYCAVR